MKYWIILITAFLVVGCQTPQYSFKLVATQSNDPENYEVASAERPLKFKISYKGFKKNEDSQSVKFAMKLTNTGSTPIIVRPTEFNLVDDEANRFSPGLSEAERRISIFPQSSAHITLTYQLPPQYSLDTVGSFRLVWNYQVGDRVYRRLSKFIKQKVQYRYRGNNGYYGGAGWWGYYPSWRFGFGYHRSRVGVGFGVGSCW